MWLVINIIYSLLWLWGVRISHNLCSCSLLPLDFVESEPAAGFLKGCCSGETMVTVMWHWNRKWLFSGASWFLNRLWRSLRDVFHRFLKCCFEAQWLLLNLANLKMGKEVELGWSWGRLNEACLLSKPPVKAPTCHSKWHAPKHVQL